MAKRPTLTPPPTSFAIYDGDITKHIGKAANLAVAMVAQELGGAEGMYDWVKKHPDNEHAFWTKLYPKIMSKQIEHSASAGIEDILKQVKEQRQGTTITIDADEVEEIEDAPE